MLKGLIKQTAVYGLSTMLGRLLNYLLVPFYTRLFTEPAAYGVVTELYAYTTFLMIIFTYGMETAYFRFSQDDKQNVYPTQFGMLGISSLVLSGLLCLLSHPLAEWMKYPDHPEYLQWMALVLGLDAVAALPFARLRQQGRASRYASLKLINIFLNIGFNLVFLIVLPWYFSSEQNPVDAFFGVHSLNERVGYIFLANLLANGITLLMLAPEFPRPQLDKERAKVYLKYGLPLMVAGLAGMTNETLDRIVLKYLIKTPDALTQVGIYGAVYKLAMLMTLFTQTFRIAAEPLFFAHAKKDSPQLLYARVMRLFAAAAIFLYLFIVVYLEYIKVFLGESYHEGLYVVPILLLANVFLGLYINLSIWFKLNDKTKYGIYFTFLGAGITLLGNLITVPLMGISGAAYTTLACYAVMTAVCYWVGQKQYPIPYPTGRILIWLGMVLCLYPLQDWVLLEGVVTDPAWRIGIKTFFVGGFGLWLLITEFRYHRKAEALAVS